MPYRFRFPLSASAAAGNISPEMTLHEPDPGLGVPRDRIDMIIGEVKEGKVNISSGATEPEILRAVVRRFGCGQEETDIHQSRSRPPLSSGLCA